MKTPKRLEPLIEDGLIDEVLRPFAGRTSHAHPEGAEPMDGYLLLLPADPEVVEAPPAGRRRPGGPAIPGPPASRGAAGDGAPASGPAR